MGKQPYEFPVNRSTALPAYVKRNSRAELKRQVKDNPRLQAKLSSKISQSDRPATTINRPTNAASPAQSAYSNDGTKDETDSDTESNTDVSLYSDEDDDLAGAPLPAKRPEESVKDAVEYDTIERRAVRTGDAEELCPPIRASSIRACVRASPFGPAEPAGTGAPIEHVDMAWRGVGCRT